MATWDELFAEGKLIARNPQTEVLCFAGTLESIFSERPLRIWDLCCGAGRHAKALAAMGHAVFASDVSPTGIDMTRALLYEQRLKAELAVSDMVICPWPSVRFHGVLSWDSLHHNTVARIKESVSAVQRQLLPGGLFLLTLKSTKADSFGTGKEIEPGTFVPMDGFEAGVPHHFFDESQIRALFEDWEILVLVELVMDYRVRGQDFYEMNPFAYTRWGILVRRRDDLHAENTH
jgi:SAM-dependent methyltransferase